MVIFFIKVRWLNIQEAGDDATIGTICVLGQGATRGLWLYLQQARTVSDITKMQTKIRTAHQA